MHRHRDVAEQVVTVFGATTAVGRAVALTAVARGARVVVAGSGAPALDALAVEADAPHRFETVRIDGSAPVAAARVAYATTARFGLLHTWVHVVGRGGADAGTFDDIAPPVLGQLRRSGGGALVVVTPERANEPEPASRELGLHVAAVDELTRERHDLASITCVRRTGVVPPARVAEAVLRAAVHPRREIVLRGSARRDALVARLVPAPARHSRPLGVLAR
jgi:hypothetical protein